MVDVSVIIPVYNVEKYIKRCLDSLVNQTLENIEFILVDDGSPDGSAEIIKEYADKFPNKIVYLYQDNAGQGAARNAGYRIAKGKYIGYVDSDDYVDTNMFKKLYDKAKEDNSDMVICGCYNVDEKTGHMVSDCNQDIHKLDIENAIFGKMAVWNKLYRRELIDGIEFRSKVWYEDLDFTIRVISKAQGISFISEPLYYYVVRFGSTMNNNNYIRNLEILDAFENLKNSNTVEKCREMIECLAIDHILISASVRIIKSTASRNEKQELLKKLKLYLEINYPDYRKNKYVKHLSRRRRIIYYMLNHKMYRTIEWIYKNK